MLKLLVLLFVIKVLPEIMLLNVGAVFVHVVVKNSQIVLTGLCLKMKEVSLSTLKRNDFAFL